MPGALDSFSPPVRNWFSETFGEPTPPQAAGWPAIQRGEHTLILAPTGSGKTLAAFLWGIDELYREAAAAPGVRLLYISPLKALNNDIERNLRAPLAGIRAAAERLGRALPPLRVAVRTGDTPGHARTAMLKQPPDILITTPESLYLILTSPRARELLRTTRTVIVDEIHTLVGNKRGAHLALSLERLEHLAGRRVQRIGLSATIKPLDEAARFLGGQEWTRPGAAHSEPGAPGSPPAFVGTPIRLSVSDSLTPPSSTPPSLTPRPVTIVDTGYRKPLDLRVVTSVEDFRNLPADSIWPTVIPQVLADVMRHRSTLIFANNRRLAERTADRLNAQIAAERSEEVPPGSTEVLAPGGISRDRGIFAIGAEGPIQAHHGSISKEARRRMEEDLKAGRLPALVGTSSLELGIDIGAVDLVVQLQSPKSVSQGLQRVGRSGHMVGQTSRGRIYATFREDLVEAAAVARGMQEGDVEPIAAPHNPLDVLAQQVVAMVAVADWRATELFDLVRQAYPYRDLSGQAWQSVIDMLTGRFAAPAGAQHSALRARIAWDGANDRLAALPGTRLLAITNGGTISDAGAYDVYLADGKTRVGQLDEEFIFETRVGDVFLLGSSVWRVMEITNDRVVVGDAAGSTPRMPFWHGDYPWRPYELGLRVGRLRGEIAERLRSLPGEDSEPIRRRLQQDYLLDENSARNLVEHVRRQLDAVGVIASDDTVVVETFSDAVGEMRMVVHSPFGGRVNGAWALALSDALHDRTGLEVETQVNDDGILLRFPAAPADWSPAGIVAALAPAEARGRLLRELPYSAVFGAHFRMNAARALLLPRARAGKRTPFWLQRLKAKDLLAVVRKLPDFPIVAETARDCLRDVLDLEHLDVVLGAIRDGAIRVVPIETVVPSPVAAGLLYNFISVYMYEWDAPKAERQLQALASRRDLLDDLLAGAASGGTPLKPEALAEVAGRAGRLAPGAAARSADELAVFFQELGDLTTDEVLARCAGDGRAWLAQLAAQGRIIEIAVPGLAIPATRWIPIDLAAEYGLASGLDLLGGSQAPVILNGSTGQLPLRQGSSEESPGRTKRPFAGDSLERPSRDRPAQGDLESTGTSGIPAGAPGLDAPEVILRRYLRRAGPVTRTAILDRYAFDEGWLDETLARLVVARDLVRGRFTPAPDGRAESQTPEEYCDRALFEQLYRRTVALLRREIEPVPLAAYAAFLPEWQGVSAHGEPSAPYSLPPDSLTPDSLTPRIRLSAPHSLTPNSLTQTMSRLRGLALPALVWERDILPARVPLYRAGDLKAAVAAGEWVWVCAGADPRRAHVRFFGRGEGDLFLGPAPDPATLGEQARTVYEFLRSEGASFAADVVAGLGRAPAVVHAALAELALAGLVTGDSLAALQAVLALGSAGGAPGERPPLSALESELAERSAAARGALIGRPASRDWLHAAERRVTQRLKGERGRPDRPAAASWDGRWSAVHRAAVLGPPLAPEERAARLVAVALARHGVVTQALLARVESRAALADREGAAAEQPWDWGDLYDRLQRMELRGEVRRGYFVAGLAGVQFALPEVVERLRALREARTAVDDILTVLNACDPANIYAGELTPAPAPGAGTPGVAPVRPKVPRLPSTACVLRGGELLLVAEDNGARLLATQDAAPDLLARALAAYLARPNAPRRVTVETWNAAPVLGSPGEPLLKSAGFSRTPSGMERWGE